MAGLGVLFRGWELLFVAGLAFRDGDEPICCEVFDHIGISTNPVDFDAINVIAFAQTEVESHAEVALIAPAAVDFVDPRRITGLDADTGSHAASIGSSASQSDLEPMVSRLGVVSQNRRAFSGIEDDSVDVAVVIEIVEGGTPAAEAGKHASST